MRRRVVHAIVLVLVASIASISLAETGDIHIWVGQKALNEDDWTVLDSHTEVGVLSNWGYDLPVNIAVDVFYSTDSTTVEHPIDVGSTVKISVETVELHGGVRKVWGKRVRPYLGGGLALIHAGVEALNSDSDQSLGFWVNAGIDFRVTKLISLGLDARLSRAEVTFFEGFASSGTDAEAGGEHFGVTLGFNF